MTDTTRPHPAEPATVALNALVERADALLAAWQGDDLPPDLSQFLPAEPPALRQLALKELIKIDLEYRWQHHELPKQVEEYVEDFPDLAEDGEVPCDLIYEEFHLRRQCENPPSPEDYYARFPNQSKRLKRMMSLDPNRTASTTLLAGAREPELDIGQQIDDFDLLGAVGQRLVRIGLFGAAAVDAAVGGAENFAQSRSRAANAGAIGSSAHCPRLRSARVAQRAHATDVHAAHSRRHAARSDGTGTRASARAA